MLAEDAIQDVIRQFADPMAFLRELVQNAIDAGTPEVSITTEWHESDRCAVVTVSDWGEGMTREIVEGRLVRLFNSTKDADRTKIGKFGIGFASVLAVNPLVVVVDTGREGEHWRVLLHPDRTYELLRLETPVEGTSVAVHMPMEPERFASFRAEALTKVRAWCRFASVPVLFDDEDIQEPFDLDGLLVARFEEEGSRVVAALRPGHATGELFNRGLLLQTVASPWAHVSFLLDSHLLEHTLTRDRVLENKLYFRALQMLEKLVAGPLTDSTQQALAKWPEDPDRVWDWEQLCALAPQVLLPAQQQAVRFPVIGAAPATVAQARAARERNRLMVTRGRSALAQHMPDDYMLLDVRPDSHAAKLLGALIKRDVPVLEDVWVFPPVIDAGQIPGAEALAREIAALLAAIGAAARSVGFAHFAYPFSCIERIGVVGTPDRSRIQHRGDLTGVNLKQRNADILLNPAHPVIEDALLTAETEPEWAAYMVIKCAALAAEAVERAVLDEALDVALATTALDRRDARGVA